MQKSFLESLVEIVGEVLIIIHLLWNKTCPWKWDHHHTLHYKLKQPSSFCNHEVTPAGGPCPIILPISIPCQVNEITIGCNGASLLHLYESKKVSNGVDALTTTAFSLKSKDLLSHVGITEGTAYFSVLLLYNPRIIQRSNEFINKPSTFSYVLLRSFDWSPACGIGNKWVQIVKLLC